jgi:cytochrome c5
LIACCAAGQSTTADAARYLDDAAFRREALEASLVNPDNGYSRLRLDHYATGAAGDWDRLPEWNPASEPIAASELDESSPAADRAVSSAASPLHLPDAVVSERDPALIALGRAAFSRYPTQLARYGAVALASRDAAARYGLWVDEKRGVGGLVRARMADGSTAIALTCASCHATRRDDAIEDGAPNAALDLGRALLDAGAVGDPASAAAIAAWGPGRLDVTTEMGGEPARIADLRPVRFQTHLHQDATLLARDATTLAIRIETLIITAHGQVVRPPRVIALALAAYVLTLADALPDARAAAARFPRGAELFDQSCAGCHARPALTGAPVPLSVIGTDPTLGRSADRGTGTYRVPSLHGVGTRGPLLHDASISSIAALFDPARPHAGFASRLGGTTGVPGHLYGLELSAPERAALIGYLEAL